MAAVKIQTRRRTALVLIFMLAIFIAVIVQLANIQFVQGSDLQQQAEDLRTKSVSVAAKRGTIYDRTGSYTTAFVLYACVLTVAIVIGMLLLRRGAAGRAQA